MNLYKFIITVKRYPDDEKGRRRRWSTRSNTLNGAIRKTFQEVPDILSIVKILYVNRKEK